MVERRGLVQVTRLEKVVVVREVGGLDFDRAREVVDVQDHGLLPGAGALRDYGLLLLLCGLGLIVEPVKLRVQDLYEVVLEVPELQLLLKLKFFIFYLVLVFKPSRLFFPDRLILLQGFF